MAHATSGNDFVDVYFVSCSGGRVNCSWHVIGMARECISISWSAPDGLASCGPAGNTWIRRWFRVARHVVWCCWRSWCSLTVALCSGARFVFVPLRVSLCASGICRPRCRHIGRGAKFRNGAMGCFLSHRIACSSTSNCRGGGTSGNGNIDRYWHCSFV